MTQENKKDNIEIVEKPEYADMIIRDVQIHGNICRKPKEWYPELLYNSEKQQPARVYTQMPNVKMGLSPNLEPMIELKLPLSKEKAEIHKNAVNSGKQFKICVPKDRIVKITFDNNLKEAIRANNRRVGFEQYKIMEGRGELVALDIDDGSLILKVVVRS